MLDGITVLNSYEVVSKTTFSWFSFWLGLIFGVIMAGIVAAIIANELSDYLLAFGIFGVFLGGLFGFLSGSVVHPKPIEYESNWEVTIDDGVSMNEFNNRYEIIEQRGEIYVIKEKEE